MSQTMRQRAAIHAYIENGAHPDVLVRERLKRDADAAVLRLVRNEPEQPEPCQFCAVEDEAPALSIREDFVISLLGVATLACLAILFFLGAP